MNIPPFTLYGLLGCSHCEEAEKFLKVRNLPGMIMIANGDPIIDEGIKKVTQSEKAEYPVLVSRVNNQIEIVKGFQKDQYDRLAELHFSSVSPNSPNVFGSGQQSIAAPSSQTEVAKSA